MDKEYRSRQPQRPPDRQRAGVQPPRTPPSPRSGQPPARPRSGQPPVRPRSGQPPVRPRSGQPRVGQPPMQPRVGQPVRGGQPPQAQKPERQRRSRRQTGSGCAGTIVYIIAVLGISIVLSLVAVFVANDVFAFVADDAEVDVTISQNTDILGLADTLDEKGIVQYGMVFKLFVSLQDKNESVLAGNYTLNPNMDYTQIINVLTQAASTETTKITIPEGYSVAQIKQLLLDEYVCTENAADEVLTEYPFKHDFLAELLPAHEGWLEGYLFPDTYEIYKGNSTVVETINKMLNNFDNKYDEQIQAGAAKLGRTMHEIVIIASLIEREAQHEEEFAKIAGVIYNRLNNPSSFPKLQIDASVLYGLGRTSGALSQADLDQDTPYNTYTRDGLPAGPICNPGYRSLYAATHPDEHGYYYYVAMPDGSHLFAATNAEHNANIARANQAAASAAANAGSEESAQ